MTSPTAPDTAVLSVGFRGRVGVATWRPGSVAFSQTSCNPMGGGVGLKYMNSSCKSIPSLAPGTTDADSHTVYRLTDFIDYRNV